MDFVLKNMTQPIIAAGFRDSKILVESIVHKNNIKESDLIKFDPLEGVEELRKKLAALNLKPHSSEFRLFVVFDADRLNPQEANTLLKTLEEPPEYVKIVLFTQSMARILPTIKSRCQKTINGRLDMRDESGTNGDFFSGNFNEFIKKINVIEIDEIPGILENALRFFKKEIKNGGETEFYKKLASSYILALNTTVNRKLLLENLFILRQSKK